MKRECESGTISEPGSGHTREGAPGDYVAAGGLAGTFIHGFAQLAEHDGWKSNDAHSHFAGGWLRVGCEDLSKKSAAHNLLTDSSREEGIHGLHQFVGRNHPANQA